MSKYIRYIKHPEKILTSSLGSLDIELTERCNNNCIHCCINLPVDDHSAKEREMSTGQIKAILQEAADAGCFQVRFTGGEPLLRDDFEEIYLFARSKGLKVLIFTNARLITPYLADLFKRISPLVRMEISVYGMHPDSYDAVSRCPGSFDQFWRGVNLLVDHGVPFIVKAALLPPNKPEMDEFEAWAETIPWMDKKPGYSMFFDLRNRRDDLHKNRLIKSLRVTPQEGLEVLTRNNERYTKGIEEFAAKFMGPHGDQLFTCGAGRSLCIDAYGFIQPCMGMRKPELTIDLQNLHTQPLKFALEHFSHLTEMQATNPDYLEHCALCILKGLCEQCPAKSWTEYGTLDTRVEYLCSVAHTQARWMGWLGPDEHGWEPVARDKYAAMKHEFDKKLIKKDQE